MSIKEMAALREYRDTAYKRKMQSDILEAKTAGDIALSLSLRWTIEGGFIAATNGVIDVADHILGGSFGLFPETFEDSLRLLKDKEVVSAELYLKMKGLGGFRNILVHEYLKVDMSELSKNFMKAFEIFPACSQEAQDWLKTVD